MHVTQNRKTLLHDLKLNQPDEGFHFNDSKETGKSLSEKLEELKNDKSPLQFSTPLYNPLTQETLSVVHPSHGSEGGFFGETRRDKFAKKQFHAGIDIDAEEKTPVLAAEDGIVTKAGVGTGYGNVIYITHRNGYQTRYAHLSEMNVKVGDEVKKGEFIGSSGKTGNAAGPKILPHLHFEIRKILEGAPPEALGNGHSTPLDPLEFLTQDRYAKKFQLILEGTGYKSGASPFPPA